MQLTKLTERALEIKKLYTKLNIVKGNKAWAGRDYAQGFVGDVGYLQKLIMAKEGLREIDDVDTKLKHELADCLWSILVLADTYNINLEQEFQKTMNDLEEKINKEL